MTLLSSRRNLSIAAMLVVMAIIFVADTVTDYAVAAPVFYSVVILAVAGLFTARALIALAGFCIALTVVSLVLTRFGAYRIGIINCGIGIVAISITTWLTVKIEATKAAAHEAQMQLLRVTRASTLGELTTSIAHEINQPLAAIVTSGNACRRWLTHDPPNLERAGQALERILDDAGRASDIIARIRGLTQAGQPHQERFDLNLAAKEMLLLSRGELERQDITLSMKLSEEPLWVDADRVQILQVIGNLLLNAIEAMSATPAAQRTLTIATGWQDPGHVRVSIDDVGSGVPGGVADHLFDAFWTTKTDGLGLGLSISRSIVEANRGRIWADNNDDGGARFQFELPAAKGQDDG